MQSESKDVLNDALFFAKDQFQRIAKDDMVRIMQVERILYVRKITHTEIYFQV